MKRYFNPLLSILSGLFLLILATAALAQQTPDTSVHIAWGDIIGQLGVDFLPWVGIALLGVIIKILPAPVRAFLTTQRIATVEQLLERGLGLAASNLQADLKGKELTIDVKNELVAQAAQYALDHGSRAIVDFMGGADAVPDKVAARLLTSPSVKAAQIGTLPPTPQAVLV